MTGEEIKKIRSDLFMSQEKFARFLGVSFGTVNRWENGKAKPSDLAIIRIKSFLEKSAKGEKVG